MVFDSLLYNDVILGQDFLFYTGVDIKYSNGTILSYGNDIPMRHPDFNDQEKMETFLNNVEIQTENDYFDIHLEDNWAESHVAAPILDAQYEKLDLHETVKSLSP